MAAEEFLLKWNDHQSKVIDIFNELCTKELLIDVTLACEDQTFTAHKLILSACSPYFRKLFTMNPCKHPIVFLKDVKSEYIEALLKFMYKGEISITQSDLMPLIQTAKSLQIKGLTDVASSGTDKARHKPPESPPSRREPSPPPKRKKPSNTVLDPQPQIPQSRSSPDSPEVVPIETVSEKSPLSPSETYINQPQKVPSGDAYINQQQKITPSDSYVSQPQNISSAVSVYETDNVSCEYESESKFGSEQRGSTVLDNVNVVNTNVTDVQSPNHSQSSTDYPTARTSHSQPVTDFTAQRLSHTQTATEYAGQRPSLSEPASDYTPKRPSYSSAVTEYASESSTTSDYQKNSPGQGHYSYGEYGQAEMPTIKTEAHDDWSLSTPELGQLCEPTVVVGEQGPSTSTVGQQDMPADPKNVTLTWSGCDDFALQTVCSICHKMFTKRTNLLRHIQTVHFGQVTYTCPHCPSKFSRNDNLKSHIQKKHTYSDAVVTRR